MQPSDLDLAGRVLLGCGVSFCIGFERELRGSPAGDRTFSLIGTAATAAAAATAASSPQALAGIITGIGFLGGGVILKGHDDALHGITTAGAVFAVAIVGLVLGTGHLLLGVLLGALTLALLELRYVPVLSLLDARRYKGRFRSDTDDPPPGAQGGSAPTPR